MLRALGDESRLVVLEDLPKGRQLRVSLRRYCRSPDPACPAICAFCERHLLSTSAKTRKDGSTASGLNHWPKSTSGLANTAPCGSTNLTHCTPR